MLLGTLLMLLGTPLVPLGTQVMLLGIQLIPLGTLLMLLGNPLVPLGTRLRFEYFDCRSIKLNLTSLCLYTQPTGLSEVNTF